MSDQRARELEERGIEAAKAGQKDDARRLLQHALRLDPASDNAWLWLASVAKDKRERLLCLQKVLEINPENEMGLKAVRAMGIDPAQLLPQRASIEDSLATEEADSRDPVPLPPADFIKQAREQAAELAARHADDTPPTPIEWTRKPKGRAGEREIWVLRAQIGAAIAAFGVFVLVFLSIAVSNSPQLQLVVFGASPTPVPPTFTATPTLTPRPDINPTQTPTIDFTAEPTFTATPTLNPLATRWPRDANNQPIYATPTPTALYLGESDNAMATAVVALRDERDYDMAIDRMRQSQREAGDNFLPHFYYFEALLLLRQDNIDAALARLDEAQEVLDDTGVSARVSRTDARIFQPMIDAATMQIYMHEIQAARLSGNRRLINERIDAMEPLFEAAYNVDPAYAEVVALMANAYIAGERYDDALEVTERALNERLASHPLVIATHGRAYLARGRQAARNGDEDAAREDFARAQYAGYYGVTMNPFSDTAHELRIEATIALGEYARASAYANQFLFYRPNSAVAFRLLAAVRAAENKPEFALDIFSEALTQEGVPSGTRAGIFVERATLYEAQRRFDLALADYNAALELLPDPATRYRRMLIAYRAGDESTALSDAESLIEADIIGVDDARLIRARIIVDSEQVERFDSALADLLAVAPRLPDDLRAIADEYQARIYFQREEFAQALAAINRALSVETGSRRYLRGILHQQADDLAAALADYDWILLWSRVFEYPFIDDVTARRDAVEAAIIALQADDEEEDND